MNSRHILLTTRPNLQSERGGDTTQVLQTRNALETLKPEWRFTLVHSQEEISQYSDASLVHVFDMRPDTMPLIDCAKEKGIPVALSTIYWDFEPMYAYNFLSRKFKMHSTRPWMQQNQHIIFKTSRGIQTLMGKKHAYLSKPFINARQNALSQADILLPNSGEEGQIVSTHFFDNAKHLAPKTHVVPNAINPPLHTEKLDDVIHCQLEALPCNLVLQVARIEPNKNQLNVLKAMMSVPDFPLVFIGRLGSQQDKHYFKALEHMAFQRGNTWIIPELPHEALGSFYRKAKVHVMPSFRESAGLSTMEALVHGCDIVTSKTPYCPNQYYRFDELGYQANPWDATSIKNAIELAYNKPKQPVDIQGYLDFYSYTNAARETLNAYAKLGIT